MFFFVFFALFCSAALGQGNIFEKAVGPCIRGQCQSGFGCLSGQCVPLPSLSTAVGPCLGGHCPGGTFCLKAQCFKA